MPEVPYFKCYRSEVATELLAASNSAFLLLLQIAWRARRTDSFNQHDLAIGEAFLGDFKNIGLTEGKYRHAKKYLEEHRFATFRATNKGTIATLINFDVFDPNLEDSNGQHNTPATNQRRTNNEPTTTNKNDKNGTERKSPLTPQNKFGGDLPPSLNFDSFMKVWLEWEQHRNEIRRPLKPTQIKKQLKRLGELGLTKAIEALNHTINMGWQGIREPEPVDPRRPSKKPGNNEPSEIIKDLERQMEDL